MSNEVDPGVSGKKLSKTDDGNLALRNKSYGKVLDAQINWIRAHQAVSPDALELKVRWQKKSEWHEKEFGF